MLQSFGLAIAAMDEPPKTPNHPLGVGTISTANDRKISRPGVGRPSKAQQEQRHQELLNASLDIFLELGFETTTVDIIAARLGMSKRTIYSLYEDKTSLFKAAVIRAIEHYTVPKSELEKVTTPDLRETLHAIAFLRLRNVCTDASIKLQRILNSQIYRFPELAIAAYSQGAGPTLEYLSALFKERAVIGEISIKNPDLAASAFLSLVVGNAARLYIVGNTPSHEEAVERTELALDIFLNGINAR